MGLDDSFELVSVYMPWNIILLWPLNLEHLIDVVLLRASQHIFWEADNEKYPRIILKTPSYLTADQDLTVFFWAHLYKY